MILLLFIIIIITRHAVVGGRRARVTTKSTAGATIIIMTTRQCFYIIIIIIIFITTRIVVLIRCVRARWYNTRCTYLRTYVRITVVWPRNSDLNARKTVQRLLFYYRSFAVRRSDQLPPPPPSLVFTHTRLTAHAHATTTFARLGLVDSDFRSLVERSR